jgi:hypothetical protein
MQYVLQKQDTFTLCRSQATELLKKADSIWQEGYHYYEAKEGWVLNKEGQDGAVVYAKKDPWLGKYLFKLQVGHRQVKHCTILAGYPINGIYIQRYMLSVCSHWRS